MKHINWWLVVGLVVVGLPLTACQRLASIPKAEAPAVVQAIDGSKLNRVTLTEKAIERIALKTDQVREQLMSRSASSRMVVPYSSLIYDAQGDTWVYISPQPRTFVRQKVNVDYIEGDIAVLNDGPPAGTVVASVGVAELYGTDSGVGH